jgi:hypothetical protein
MISYSADEARPVCIKCKKRNLKCDGPKDPTWVGQTEVFLTKTTPKNAIRETSLQVEISLAAFEDDICLAYTRKNLLRGGLVDLACNMIDCPENDDIFTENLALGLLRKALLSLSVTFFGNQHREDRITAKGYNRYGEVLRQLNAVLAIPERQTTNETILTAMTCMLLELFLPLGPSKFLEHQRGIEAMMTLRGPPTKSIGDTATIFRGLRIVSIIGSLAQARPSLYAREEWKHAPIAHTSRMGMLQADLFTVLGTFASKKSHVKHILTSSRDLTAECTQLTSDCNGLLASGTALHNRGPLLAQIDDTMNNLIILYPVWARINNDQLQQSRDSLRMAKELGIANRLSASAYMLYYTAYICILQMKDSLEPSSTNKELRNDAAMKIATCLELKGHDEQEGAAESNAMSFVATKIAWQALGGLSTPEGRKLARVVGSSVNGLYRSPWGDPLASSDIWQREPQVRQSETWHTATSTTSSGTLSEARLHRLLR